MENIKRVPLEFVKIIPEFNGEHRLLPLFIKKCEYILQNFQGDTSQNEYLFHVITSRLSGEAAKIVGERDQIVNWEELKELLNQNFGDPRTEECLSLELENLKLSKNESYLEFCHRIQQVRSILYSKLNSTINNIALRQAKINIYDNTALNIFLYNLPAYLVRLVRLRNVLTLEDALKVVLEEQNFQSVYNAKNKLNIQQNNFKNNNQFLYRTPRYSSSNGQNFSSPGSSFSQNNNFNPHFNSSNHNFNSRNNFSPQNNFNSQNFQTNFHTKNNSFQMRNPNSVNNYERRNHFMNKQHDGNRSPHLQSQRLTNNGRNGHWTPDVPEAVSLQNKFTPSGNNTDVTMRTASTRRVNYTDFNSNNNQHVSNYEPQCENFQIGASNRELE